MIDQHPPAPTHPPDAHLPLSSRSSCSRPVPRSARGSRSTTSSSRRRCGRSSSRTASSCHGAKKQKGGAAARLRRPGSSRAARPGRSSSPATRTKSLLVQVIRYDGDIKMPPEGEAGGRGHRDADGVGEGRRAVAGRCGDQAEDRTTAFDLHARAKAHWSFQPVEAARCARSSKRETRSIDASCSRSCDEKGLTFAPPADKRVLLRRVYFDLIGLPPTPEEIDAFLKDDSPDAYEKVVDRLLASPALRRALGPALARPRPLRRDARPRVRLRHPRRLALPRLRHPRVQRRRAVRPVPHRAHRRRPARPAAAQSEGRHERVARGDGFLVAGRGEALAGRFAGGVRGPDRQPDRRVRQGGARADDRLCPLPRPQVRRRSPRRTTTRCSACSRVRATTGRTSTIPPRP